MKKLTLFMAVCCGLTVANLYYCQPLLPLIATEFKISNTAAGSITYLTQLGYAAGMLLFVPLGDLLEKKQQILWTVLASIVTLLGIAFSPSFAMLQVLSFLIGVFSVVPQLIVPLAANLASDEKRGSVIGLVMGGLLIGIVSSRSLSGYVGYVLGWREMYFIAALIGLVLLILIKLMLPSSRPIYKGTYKELMLSMAGYVKHYPQLRKATLRTAISFATMSSFWVTMVLLLSARPFLYNSVQIGLFGIIGATGALAAPLVGKRSSDNSHTVRKITFFGLSLQLLAYIAFYFTGSHILLLIAGIILIDIGHQSIQISNQTLIYSLDPTARNRFNTIFMTTSFIGGALGSAVGLSLFHAGGWSLFCAGMSCLILVNMLLNKK